MKLLKSFPKYVHIQIIQFLQRHLKNGQWTTLEDVVPQLVPIIEKLDEKIKAKYPQENVAIIDKNNLVHMAHMDIHYGFSINGVAALHTEILKTPS